MALSRVKIVQDDFHGIKTFIDDVEINGVRSILFTLDAKHIPVIRLELYAEKVDIECGNIRTERVKHE